MSQLVHVHVDEFKLAGVYIIANILCCGTNHLVPSDHMNKLLL